MAKVVQYVITSIGIMLLLGLVGAPTFTSTLLNSFFGSGGAIGILNGNFHLTNTGIAILVLGLLAFSTALIAFVSNVFRPSESVIVAVLSSTLFGLFVADIVSVISIADSFGALTIPIKALMILILLPYTAGFIMSLVAFWRGNDI
jgi:hypothetical protein